MGIQERKAARSFRPEVQEEQELRRELENMRIPTAAYCRLSLEGEESIDNQISLVHEYIRDSPDLLLVDTYVDNGYTGTSFDRPEWTRLMMDVQQGRINAIVVKDLSRFGRNYIDSGKYISEIFPRLGVRFIAITDNFDNTREDDRADLIVPMKNVMNYAYAKDMSCKIHASFELKKRSGEALGTPAFGYFRANDGDRRNVLRIDEENAPIVRMMYHWMASGVELADIARRLNLMGVPTPSGGIWVGKAMRRYLSNPVYCGDFVSGRWVRNMHVTTKTDKESWLIFEEHHEPIVSRALWKAAQKKLPKRKRGKNRPRILDGLLVCACCGRQLMPEEYKEGLRYDCPYHTGVRAREASAKGEVIPLPRRPTIPEKKLMETVLAECRNYMEWLEDVTEEVRLAGLDRGLLGELQRRTLDLMREKKQVEERMLSLFDDFHGGLLDGDSFAVFNKKASERKRILEKAITDLLSEQRKTKAGAREAMAFITSVSGLHFEEGADWNEEDVRELVERVELHPDCHVTVKLKMKERIKQLLNPEIPEISASSTSFTAVTADTVADTAGVPESAPGGAQDEITAAR